MCDEYFLISNYWRFLINSSTQTLYIIETSLSKVAKRNGKVDIENVDVLHCIKLCNTTRTFHYLAKSRNSQFPKMLYNFKLRPLWSLHVISQVLRKCHLVVHHQILSEIIRSATLGTHVADKPRDAFARLTAWNVSFPHMLPCRIWSFWIKWNKRTNQDP